MSRLRQVTSKILIYLVVLSLAIIIRSTSNVAIQGLRHKPGHREQAVKRPAGGP